VIPPLPYRYGRDNLPVYLTTGCVVKPANHVYTERIEHETTTTVE
jgi:hypothetical protein